MSSIDEIRDARIKKLKLLQDRDLYPYPAEAGKNRECIYSLKFMGKRELQYV